MSETPDEQLPVTPEEDAVDPCVQQLQRERADFRNYKRRVDRERAEDRDRARQELVQQLLPAIDDLDRALDHLPAELSNHPWAQGIALARMRLLDALGKVGVERIGSTGERFDPAVHEAIVYHEEQSAHEQHVQSVLRPGYRLGPRLLRPAQVVVAGPPRNGSATTNASNANANQGRHHDGQSTRN
jgi:molecular chaperone GrpE